MAPTKAWGGSQRPAEEHGHSSISGLYLVANGFAEEPRTFGLCSLALFTAISPLFRQPLFKRAQEVRCSRPPRRPPVSPVSECHSQDDLCAAGGAISGECDGTARSSRTSGPCQTGLRSDRLDVQTRARAADSSGKVGFLTACLRWGGGGG